MRVATIDLGSNSCVFLAVERRDGVVRRIDSHRIITRLGAGIDARGTLAAEAIERTLSALRIVVDRADGLGVDGLAAVGTAALREASNRHAVIDAAAGFGLPLRAISGEEEAALSYASAGAQGPALVVDVGGASTEFAWGQGASLDGRVSVPIGSVRLHERIGLGAPVRPGGLEALAAEIDGALAGLPELAGRELLAVAGTAVSAAQAHMGLMAYDHERIDGHRLPASALNALIGAMAALSVEERIARYGLDPGRADVLPAGLMILARATRRLGLEALTVRDRGVAWGLALRLLEER